MLNSQTKKALEDFAKEVISKVAKLMKQKKRNASGNFTNSLRYEIAENELIIYGASYAEFVERGRKRGKMPPIRNIKRWIKDKKLSYDDLDSVAWAIAKKIAKKGTEQSRKGNAGILTVALSEDLVRGLTKKLTNVYSTEIRTNIIDAVKRGM